MKRKLTAVAALLAAGASMAQVTITGSLGMSWQQDPTILGDAKSNAVATNLALANGGHAQGMRINDGEIYVSATEDLGAGWSATARGGVTMRGRGTSIMDRDGTVSVSNKSGLGLTAGAVRSCGNLMAVSSGLVNGPAYSPNEANNYVPLDKCSIVDIIALAVPVTESITVTGTYGEFGSAFASSGATSGTDSGNPTGIAFYDIQAIYKNGPLMFGMNYTPFIGVGTGTGAALAGFPQVNGAVRTRYFASYDAGFAKAGLGLQQKTGGTADQWIASLSAPLPFLSPALSVGIDYTARGEQGAYDKSNNGTTFQSTADYSAWALGNARQGDVAAYSVGVGAKYSFSKTLSLDGSYITYNGSGANNSCGPVAVAAVTTAAQLCPTANTAANNFGKTAAILDTEYRIRLLKTF